jgi:hypothetical protein
MARMLNPVKWQPDEATDTCALCRTEFGILVRKHHCRNCGFVVCDACSPFRMALPHLNLRRPERVCSKCRNALAKPPPPLLAAVPTSGAAAAKLTTEPKPVDRPIAIDTMVQYGLLAPDLLNKASASSTAPLVSAVAPVDGIPPSLADLARPAHSADLMLQDAVDVNAYLPSTVAATTTDNSDMARSNDDTQAMRIRNLELSPWMFALQVCLFMYPSIQSLRDFAVCVGT